MDKLKKVTGSTALALVLGAGAMSANADLITTWDFTVTGEWVTGATQFGPGGGVQVNTSTLLSWGADTGSPDPVDGGSADASRSGLSIDTPIVSDQVDTGAGTVDTILVTHSNNVVSGTFSTLQEALFLTTLTLTPNTPAGAQLAPVSQNVPVLFAETTNEGSPGACGFPSVSACDDVFIFLPETLSFSFTIDDYAYTTTIGAPELGLLPEDTCNEVGIDNCFGLTTQEEAVSPVQFNFRIDARQVPLPGTLGLLGLGMLGLAARKRARSA